MTTIFEQLGPENLKELVDTFYDLVLQDSTIAPLFKNDINEIKRKQYMFLTQFLGGPPLYNTEFGHPRMRMRHMPHKIDNAAKDAWLNCMNRAINSLKIEDDLKSTLYNCFPHVAQHMVNS